jgi:hypothetical protein
VDYREYVFKHGSIWGVRSLKWGYAVGAGDDRKRHQVVQAYRMRIEYRSRVGHYGDHLAQFRRVLRSSGAAG